MLLLAANMWKTGESVRDYVGVQGICTEYLFDVILSLMITVLLCLTDSTYIGNDVVCFCGNGQNSEIFEVIFGKLCERPC